MEDPIADIWMRIQDFGDRMHGIWDESVSRLLPYAEGVLRAVGCTDPAAQKRALAAILAAVFGLLLLLVFRGLRRRGRGGSLNAPLVGVTRRPRILGYAAATVFLAAFGAWASIAPLASAALAPGVVSPEGHRKTIQHLEGGIIQAIHVREGDVVVPGQKLVTLEETQARAQQRELRERVARLLAMEARLVAEQNGAESIAYPEELIGMADVDARRAMDGETVLLQSRRASRSGREQILGQRVRQLEEEIAGLQQVISAQDRQIALLKREIDGAQKLFDQGLERLPRLLALQRASAEVDAGRATSRAQIARNEQAIGETRMQLLTMREEAAERVNEDLTKVRGSLAELHSQSASREDVLARTIIRAPVSGTVMNVRVTTESGVVGPGEPILDIVPTYANLIIDAQVKPTDIDNVRPGMKTRVLLTGYRQRNLPQIHGVLLSISADRLVEDRSGHAYYLAKVEVDPDEIAKIEDVRLIPGMPAEVMILNGEQTLLEYLLRPLVESITKSLRES